MPQRRRAWLAEALIIAALMLLPLLFWWRLWALDPANRQVIPEGDFTSQYYPLQLFAARELAAGRLPAWDPFLNAGQPGLADIQTGFYYPFNLVPSLILAAAGLPFTLSLLTAQVILHFSLASLFTYLFVRHLARRTGARIPAARFAGAVAALSFSYAGYLTSFPVQQLTILETAIWLPLVLLFLDRACHHARPLPQIVLAGLALACAFLAGHPQTAMYVVYTAVAYGLFIQALRAPKNLWVYLLRAGRTVLLPLLLGAALAAVQLWPTLAFITRSTRAGLDYQAVSWGFPLVELTQLLYPGYFGGSPQYVGILPPVLAVAALLMRRARREVVFWIIFAAVTLLLALGGHTFLYNIAYLIAPGFSAVRDQQRIVFLFSFAISVLAGYGALVLVQPLEQTVRGGFRRFVRGLVWVAIAFAALTAVWVLGYLQGQQQGVQVNLFEGVLRQHMLLLLILGGSALLFALRLTGKAERRNLMTLALALIWLNLFTVNWQYNLADPVAGGLYPQTGMVTYLKEQPSTFRISSAGLLPGGSSAGAVYELEDITGNTPLRLDAFQQFEDRLGSWRRWQLLNVEYVLSRDDLAGPGLEQVYEEGGVKAYRVGDPLPRAWLVHRTTIADDDQAFNFLNAEDFDPRAVAVLAPGQAQLPALESSQPGNPAQVVQTTPGRLVLDVSSPEQGMLVVSQPFYRGWQASVDGARAPLYRVDYLLQGILLGSGSHRVELSYHLSLLPAILSLTVWFACLAALILNRSRPGRRTAGSSSQGEPREEPHAPTSA